MLVDLLRHIEGDESAEEQEEDEAYDNFDMDYNFGLSLCDSGGGGFSNIRQQQQQQHPYTTGVNNPDHNLAGPNSIAASNLFKDFDLRLEQDTEIELDSDFDIDEEHAHINRVMGYKHYPEVLIDDADAGFPLLHEIGETIDELQLVMHAHLLKYSLSL